MSFQLQSSSPRQARELYSPPPRWDSENPVPTEEESSASSEVHYKSDIYTPPPSEPRFVRSEPEPTITISWPTPAADRTRKPESPSQSEKGPFCSNVVVGGSCIATGCTTVAVGVGLFTIIKAAWPAPLVAGMCTMALGVAIVVLGVRWFIRSP